MSHVEDTKRKWAFKRSTEVDYRGVDWKTDLDSGETIASYDFVLQAGSTLVKGNKSLDANRTVQMLSGGTAGTTEQVVARIVTSTGRELEVLCEMQIT